MKVLIVEDDEMVQRLYIRMMQNAGHTVVTVNDGCYALDAAKTEHPDIILMDVMMPIMNGIEALKQIKESGETKAIPVIMLSANDDALLMQQAFGYGASRFLVKSNVDPSDVVTFVEETLMLSKPKQP